MIENNGHKQRTRYSVWRGQTHFHHEFLSDIRSSPDGGLLRMTQPALHPSPFGNDDLQDLAAKEFRFNVQIPGNDRSLMSAEIVPHKKQYRVALRVDPGSTVKTNEFRSKIGDP